MTIKFSFYYMWPDTVSSHFKFTAVNLGFSKAGTLNYGRKLGCSPSMHMRLTYMVMAVLTRIGLLQ